MTFCFQECWIMAGYPRTDLHVLRKYSMSRRPETYLVVQWLRLCSFPAGSMGSNPGPGTKSLHAVQQGQNKFFNKINNYVMSFTGTDCN